MSEQQVPSWMSQEAIDTLSRGYLYKGETPRGMYERLASTASKILDYPEIEADLFEMFWLGLMGPASPVLSNMGTNRGLPVSCFGVNIGDSVSSIYSHLKEVAALSKHGGGIGAYFGNIRPSGSPISSGGKSIGMVPWMRQYDQAAAVVSQGGVRRGSFALYMPIDHPDLPEALRCKDHTKGDPRDFIDSNLAVVITDEWITSMLLEGGEKQALFGEVIRSRLISGSPYITFIDNVNKANPQCYAERGLEVQHSQLCNEITLFNDENHTYTCVLSSMNAAMWEVIKTWRGKNTGMSAPELSIWFLDSVNEEFIHKAERITSMGRAVRFATKSRALGLGTMGIHSLYQSLHLPFDSEEASALNVEIHSFIKSEAVKASKNLAARYGEPEWCEGSGMRNTHLLAIAPTKSNSVICGAGSEGIEPIEANYYVAKGAKGTFVRKNPHLERHLGSIGENTAEVWESILDKRGSVQHLDFLDEHSKEVFKTAREINQFALLQQAGDRQKYVCQGQSLNLFVDAESSADYLLTLHLKAWNLGLKGLYYLKSNSLLVKSGAANRVADIVTKDNCPYCLKAKVLLKNQGWKVQERDVSSVPDFSARWKTVPQIWLGGKHIGGYTDLEKVINGTAEAYEACVACEG